MFHFKKMIEEIRRNGIVLGHDVQDPRWGRDYERINKVPAGDLLDTSPVLWKQVEECHPFVYAGKGKFEWKGDTGTAAQAMGYESGGAILDIPFRVCSFEMLARDEAFTLQYQQLPQWALRYIDANKLVPYKIAALEGMFNFTQLCLMVCEQAPGLYSFISYGFISEDVPPFAILSYSDSFNIESGQQFGAISILLNELKKSQLGVEHVKERVKIGSGKEKRPHTIRRVVHICPKRYIYERNETTGREVDWSHRWQVRGHWRKIEGIGKDRAGEYCVPGNTWVIEHEKGPEDLPLVSKVRVLEQGGEE